MVRDSAAFVTATFDIVPNMTTIQAQPGKVTPCTTTCISMRRAIQTQQDEIPKGRKQRSMRLDNDNQNTPVEATHDRGNHLFQADEQVQNNKQKTHRKNIDTYSEKLQTPTKKRPRGLGFYGQHWILTGCSTGRIPYVLGGFELLSSFFFIMHCRSPSSPRNGTLLDFCFLSL
jgi:hypothetical protein